MGKLTAATQQLTFLHFVRVGCEKAADKPATFRSQGNFMGEPVDLVYRSTRPGTTDPGDIDIAVDGRLGSSPLHLEAHYRGIQMSVGGTLGEEPVTITTSPKERIELGKACLEIQSYQFSQTRANPGYDFRSQDRGAVHEPDQPDQEFQIEWQYGPNLPYATKIQVGSEQGTLSSPGPAVRGNLGSGLIQLNSQEC